MAYPRRILTDLMEGLEMLDRVMPGINSDSTLLYGPEIKFYAMRIATDNTLRTKVPNLYVAGDGAGIGGAIAAELSGELAALQAAYQLGGISQAIRNTTGALMHKRLKKELAIRPFLDTLYAPDFQAMLQSDDTMICRCEEVTVGQLRNYAREGCLGLNQTKVFSRCGMGPCQGRQCGSNAAIIIADERNIPIEHVDYYRLRAPIKPVSLSEVASLSSDS